MIRALEDLASWTDEGEIGEEIGVRKRDLEGAARAADGDRAGDGEEDGGDDGCGGGSCAAGESFSLDAALVGPEGERAVREGDGEVHVDALGSEGWVAANLGAEKGDVGEGGGKEDRVRDSCVDEMESEGGMAEIEGEVEGKVARLSEANGHILFSEPNIDQPVVHENTLGRET
ncbi:MAG: hypothetical protein Q8L98_07960 [Chlamydiales bacterium]|nr:hypothetical protein [Chlamydiales bacterium]